MRKLIYYTLFQLIFLNIQAQSNPCLLFDASLIDSLQEIKKDSGGIKQILKANHDTIATDLIMILRDFKTNEPLKNVYVMVTKELTKVSDSTGFVYFNAFGTGGNYTISINRENYHCIEIDNLHFNSGEVRWIEVKLRKTN